MAAAMGKRVAKSRRIFSPISEVAGEGHQLPE
jgi:hypothetical protein